MAKPSRVILKKNDVSLKYNASGNGSAKYTYLNSLVNSSELLNENGKIWYFYDTGVPHLINFTQNLEKFDVKEYRVLYQKYNPNVNLAKFDGGYLKARTYEREAQDETLACGTGMVACFFKFKGTTKFKNISKIEEPGKR